MIFIDAAFGKKTPWTPVWFMRQAGRYLKEYKEIRSMAGSFLSLCQNTPLATEITLQPINILDVDAAILFSDILVVPLAMGLPLEFRANEGPVFLETVRDKKRLDMLKKDAFKRLGYVYETLSMVRKKLPKDKALIGFCGSPWTLATYMIEGEGSKTYAHSKKMLYSNPALLHTLLDTLTNELIGYAKSQILAGANALQIFDSWGGSLEVNAYMEFSWKYMLRIAREVKSTFPNVPIILFPKGVGAFLERLEAVSDNEFDVFGVDWGVSMERARNILGEKYVLQGNLEPARLYDKTAMEEGTLEILKVMNNKRHIFNLGHGMLPDLPRENAIALVKMIKDKTRR